MMLFMERKMPLLAPKHKTLRYERKFVDSILGISGIRAMLKYHHAGFLEPYPPRFINNIYLDSRGMKTYVDHIDGRRCRYKLRIRWYGDLLGSIEKPVLEVKNKVGHVGYKHLFNLDAFTLDSNPNYDSILSAVQSSDIPDSIKCQVSSFAPKLVNRYHRRYYVSRDKRFRVTLDSNVTYYRPAIGKELLRRSFARRNATVIELKYDGDDALDVDSVSSTFPFTLYKNSKYIDGLDTLTALYGPI